MSATLATATAPAVGGGLRPLDVAALRREFPILLERVNGKPLIYLDNAATSQKPRCMLDAIRNYYEHANANVHRGVHRLSERATELYEGARDKVRTYLNASRREEIVYVRGVTEAVNLVAQAYARPRLKSGDEILITWLEHHSNIVPWQMLCEQTGATLRVVPVDDAGALRMDEFARLLTPRVKLVSVGHISNALGTINPVAEMARMAHAVGAVIFVDGAQGAQHLRVDVRALDCDFYAISGHKMYGPTGIGALFGKFSLLNEMAPYQGGGDMIASVSFSGTIYNELPHKFEAGTPHIAGAVGLGATVDFLSGLDFAAVAAHEQDLLEYGMAMLRETPEVRLVGTAADKASVVSFVIQGVHPHDAGTILDQEGIAIRSGHHCAQPLMERFGIAGTCRASMSFYNTRAELDALAAGVRKVIQVFA